MQIPRDSTVTVGSPSGLLLSRDLKVELPVLTSLPQPLSASVFSLQLSPVPRTEGGRSVGGGGVAVTTHSLRGHLRKNALQPTNTNPHTHTYAETRSCTCVFTELSSNIRRVHLIFAFSLTKIILSVKDPGGEM